MAQSQHNLNSILETQSQLQALFAQRMDEIECELKKAGSPSSMLSVTSLAGEYYKFKDFVLSAFRSIQSQISLLSSKLDKFEAHKRRKILLLHGVPEVNEENTTALVTDVIVNRLKLGDLSDGVFSRCHRIGRSSADSRPRPILIKFNVLEQRNKVWFSKTLLRGSGITLSEFLTKANHDVFMAARRKFGVTKCWTRDGAVFVLGADGVRHRVDCISDFDKVAVPVAGARKQARGPKEPVPTTKARRTALSNKK
ncbi:uncharacterized protein LOC115445491 [Manduca sexta]|uniref:uncharacterized protein LOC115445491 n=1 Tax=Manduca sexta TaxID=7130 RepID=UPI0011827D75|nr:uncharacterized protein LOC115445491 [Manduca sexta]